MVVTGRRAIGLIAVAVGLGSLPAACSSNAPLVGAGGTCTLATDCQEGLACLPQKDGTSICSNDLAAVQATEDSGAGKEAAAPVEGGEQDTGTTQQDTGTPVQDTGTGG